MPDDETQGQPTPETSGEEQSQDDWASEVVEIEGRQMKRGDVVKSYAEAEKKMRRMEADLQNANNQVNEYKQWADPIKDAYNDPSNPSYKEGFDALYQAGATTQQPHTVSPDFQKQMQLEVEVHRMKVERDIDRIKQEGLPLTEDMEKELLMHMHNNSQHDTEAGYFKLFGRQAIADARRDAVKQTADHIAQNQGSYEAPTKGGGAPQPKKVDVSKLTPTQLEEAAIERIKKDLF